MNPDVASHGRSLSIGVSAAAAAVSLLLAAAWWRWRRREMNKPTKPDDSAWRRVGEVSDIVIYPLKSGAGIQMQNASCTVLGLQYEHLRDRFFMVCREDGSMITARTYSNMVLIHSSFDGEIFRLETAGKSPIDINVKDAKLLKKVVSCNVWGETVYGVDCGEKAADWLTSFILNEKYKPENGKLRLIYHLDSTAERTGKEERPYFPLVTPDTMGAYSDLSAYLLINEESVAEVESRVGRTVIPRQFRPNILIRGPPAYEEDKWLWIRIGAAGGPVFLNVKPCTRCMFTTIDPNTGERDRAGEPLKTLKTYRQLEDPALRKAGNNSPIMGINLGLYSPGTIKINDPVYVA